MLLKNVRRLKKPKYFSIPRLRIITLNEKMKYVTSCGENHNIVKYFILSVNNINRRCTLSSLIKLSQF